MSRLYGCSVSDPDGSITVPIDNHNSMNMIWHNDKFIQINLGEMIGNFLPKSMGGLSNMRESHFATSNPPKKWFLVKGADGQQNTNLQWHNPNTAVG